MAQNIYDDPAFFAGYSEFPRSKDGLAATAEWPALSAMLPAIAGSRVLDLGCGFGQFSRWAGEQGAANVLGVDLSEKMLDRARAETANPAVSYRRADLETLELPVASFDLVFSSMAFHYIADFARLARAINFGLVPGGSLVFSVEHPIFSARAEPDWVTAADGGKAWAIQSYFVEGKRITNWVTPGIEKYHRTIATMLRDLRGAGLVLRDMEEWHPSDAELDAHPDWRDELHRPIFLLFALTKPEAVAP